MEHYILSNGWIVRGERNRYFLEVTPIEDTIFQKRAVIELPIEIALEVKKGEINITNLFKKFGLHKLIISWIPKV